MDHDRPDSVHNGTVAGRHLLRGVASVPAQWPAEPAVPDGAGGQEAQFGDGPEHGRSVGGGAGKGGRRRR